MVNERHAVTTMVGSTALRLRCSDRREVREFNLNSRTIFHRCLKPVWDPYEPAPGDEKPRISHVLVTTSDRIILFVPLSPSPSPLVTKLCRFGGADGRYHHSDT
jgi:hypothetical protein